MVLCFIIATLCFMVSVLLWFKRLAVLRFGKSATLLHSRVTSEVLPTSTARISVPKPRQKDCRAHVLSDLESFTTSKIDNWL